MKNTPESFWNKVDRSGGPSACWLWQGALCAGYGRLSYGGTPVLAHRLAYSLSRGEVAGDALILHGCDEPRCCNPAHLRPGTHADNAMDRKVRKRHWRDRGLTGVRGVKHPSAVMDERMVRDIRALSAGGSDAKQIAQRLGVARHNVYNVLRGLAWKHVDAAV